MWVEFDKVEQLVTSAKALFARRVEEGGSWKREGCRSAADSSPGCQGHLIRRRGSSSRRRRRRERFPRAPRRLRSGKLSGAKARVVIGAAAVNGDAEAELLDDAESLSFGELGDKCLKAKAKDSKRAHKRIREERYARDVHRRRRRLESARPRDL